MASADDSDSDPERPTPSDIANDMGVDIREHEPDDFDPVDPTIGNAALVKAFQAGARMKIINVLVSSARALSVNEICDRAEIDTETFRRHRNDLLEWELITLDRTHGNAKYYTHDGGAWVEAYKNLMRQITMRRPDRPEDVRVYNR